MLELSRLRWANNVYARAPRLLPSVLVAQHGAALEAFLSDVLTTSLWLRFRCCGLVTPWALRKRIKVILRVQSFHEEAVLGMPASTHKVPVAINHRAGVRYIDIDE